MRAGHLNEANTMLKMWEFSILTGLALIGAMLAGANTMLFQANRAAQADISGRQQYIAQSVQLEGLYREMVKALADLSIKSQDGDLRALLADQGISISVTPNTSASPPTSDGPKKAGK
jgi:hypothetical protein